MGGVDADDRLDHGAVASPARVAHRDLGRQLLGVGGRLRAAVEEGERPFVVRLPGCGLAAHCFPVEGEAQGSQHVAAARALPADLLDPGGTVEPARGEDHDGGQPVGRRPQPVVATLTQEDEVELAAHDRAVRVMPDLEGAEQAAGRRERALRFPVQQQGLETGAPRVAETLLRHFEGPLELLPELVLRCLGIGIADAPEPLDEGVALVVVPQLAEHAALRVGQDRGGRVEEVRVPPVEGGCGVLGEGGGGEEGEEDDGHG